MSALFNFSSFVVVLLLTICTCTYVKGKGGHGRQTWPPLPVTAYALGPLQPRLTPTHCPACSAEAAERAHGVSGSDYLVAAVVSRQRPRAQGATCGFSHGCCLAGSALCAIRGWC